MDSRYAVGLFWLGLCSIVSLTVVIRSVSRWRFFMARTLVYNPFVKLLNHEVCELQKYIF